MLLGRLALVWSKELVRGRSGRPLNCDLVMAAEPRRQSVVRVVTVDFFYRRAPAYSAELKPGNLVRDARAGEGAGRQPARQSGETRERGGGKPVAPANFDTSQLALDK